MVAAYDARMFQLDEQTQMVAGVIRQWCQSTLLPKIPALEAGTEMPFDLMKKMAKAFGFDAMLGGALKKRIAKLRAGDEDDAEKMMSEADGQSDDDARRRQGAVARVARLRDGLRRVDRSRRRRDRRKGTADQIERWGLPISTMQQIGSVVPDGARRRQRCVRLDAHDREARRRRLRR